MFSKGNRSAGGASPNLTSGHHTVPSIIAADMTVTGDIKSDGQVQIDGSVNGDVDAHDVTIGTGATVRGEITADAVRVCGTVVGLIRAREVSLIKTSHVEGDIHHEVLSIEAGAHVDGACRRMNSPVPPTPPAISGTVWEPAQRQGLAQPVE